MTTTGTDRLDAALAILAELHVTQLNRGHATAGWWATGTHQGRERTTTGWPTAEAAVEELLRAVVSATDCPRCRRHTVLGPTALPGRCALVRHGDTYTRTCDRRTVP
jgi:hypothetical protein